jgi:hypothetical protein
MRQQIMQPSKNAESRDESEAEGHAGALKLDVICHRLLDASQSHDFSLHILGRGASGSRVVAFPMREDPLALRLRLHATSDECMIPLHEIAFKVGSWRRSQDLENEVNMQETASLAGLAPAPIHCAWLATTAPTPFRGVLAMRRLTGPTLYKWLRLLARDNVRSLEGAGPWLREAQRLRHRIGDLGLVNTDIHDNNLVFDVTDPTIRAAVFREREPSAALQAQLLAAIAQGPTAQGNAKAGARLVLVDWGLARPLSESPAVRVFDRCTQSLEASIANCATKCIASIHLRTKARALA